MKKSILIVFAGLLFSFFLNGQTWDFYDLTVAASNYDMVSDNNGGVHLIWKAGGRQIGYGKITFNSGTNQYEVTNQSFFTTTHNIFHRFTRPRAAVKGDGSEIHVIFQVGTPGKYLTHVWKDASGWHEAIMWNWPENGTNWYIATPSIGVDLNGSVHVVAQLWRDGHGAKIIYKRRAAGGSWGSGVSTVQTNDAPWRDVSAYTDRNGGFHATWKTGQKTYGIYKFAANGASLANSPAIQIPNLGGSKPLQDMVAFGETAMAPNGDVHHTYTHYNDVTLRHTIKPAGSSTFGTPTLAATINNCEHCGNPVYENPWCTLGILPNGVPLVGWAENKQSGAVNHVNIAWQSAGVWETYEVDNLAAINAEGRPVIAITDSTTFMVWRRATGYLRLAAGQLSVPSIRIITPNGGENLGIGRTYPIQWDHEDLSNNIKISLKKDGSVLGTIVPDLDPSTGTYTWTVGNYDGGTATVGAGYQIKIRELGTSVNDTSESIFTLSNPALTVTSPNGGENLALGASHDITWNAAGMHAKLKITLWKDGSLVGTIAKDIFPGQGSYSWTVGSYIGGTATIGTGYTVKIKESGSTYTDTSDAGFEISGPNIAVTSPNGGESWNLGSSQDITWTASGLSGLVKISLWRDGSVVGVIAKNVNPASGSYSWNAGSYIGGTAPSGTGYTIKIKENGTAVADTSDAGFALTSASPTLTVTAPNGGESWDIGTSQDITWNRTGTVGNVKITLWKGGVQIGVIAIVSSASGSYSWTAGNYVGGTATGGSDYTIKIKEVGSAVSDISDGNFTLNSI